MTNAYVKDSINSHQQSNNSYTPLIQADKESLIAHINEEHLDELQNFLRVFKQVSEDHLINSEIRLTEIFVEGLLIELNSKLKGTNEEPLSSKNEALANNAYYIAFQESVNGLEDLQMQYVLLKQQADKKMGKKTIKITEQNFMVKDSYKVSKNMQRLILTPLSNDQETGNNVPNVLDHEAGYAYLFDLTTPNQSDTPAREHCYYTLRKAWKVENNSNQNNDAIKAWVDVFIHGDTSGGNWATALRSGDTIKTKREFPEKIEHLQAGQALLIADETSMPTVARLLETWQNPISPLIICITQDEADQAYFDDVAFSSAIGGSLTILPLIIGNAHAGKDLADLIDTYIGNYLASNPLRIEKVWGALEASTVKALRPLLRERFGLERSDVVIKVYWRQD